MDLRSSSPSDIIGGLKDRFGFGNKNDSFDSYDEYGDDEFYDYEQYAPTPEQEYADAQEYHQDSYGNDPYDRLEYTTRPSRRSSRVQSAPLVSARDIRATTPSVLSSGSSTAPVATSVMPAVTASSITSSSTEEEGYDVPITAYTDFVSPYKDKVGYQGELSRSAASTVASGTSGFGTSGTSSSSSGLDSLFTPTTPLPSNASSLYGSEVGVSAAGAASAYGSGGQQASQMSPSYGAREIELVKPQAYDDVAGIAQVVRAGALVVLSLHRCDAALAKRVLDFSFGVASALEARVECVADKTFVLATGEPITLDEQHRIRQMGA